MVFMISSSKGILQRNSFSEFVILLGKRVVMSSMSSGLVELKMVWKCSWNFCFMRDVGRLSNFSAQF